MYHHVWHSLTHQSRQSPCPGFPSFAEGAGQNRLCQSISLREGSIAIIVPVFNKTNTLRVNPGESGSRIPGYIFWRFAAREIGPETEKLSTHPDTSKMVALQGFVRSEVLHFLELATHRPVMNDTAKKCMREVRDFFASSGRLQWRPESLFHPHPRDPENLGRPL